jgi:hypothetical protein
MPRAKSAVLKVSVSELLDAALGASYAPKEISEENRLIHHMLGLDGGQEYSVVLGGLESFNDRKPVEDEPILPQAFKPLCLVFRPDAIRDGVVYELKVLRRYSDRNMLLLRGYLQLQLELYALGLERGKLLLYRVYDQELEEADVEINPIMAEEILAFYQDMLAARRRLIAKLLNEVLKAMHQPGGREE